MPGYVPFNYEHINIAAGTYSPSAVKSYNNEAFDFWARALFQRALSVVDITLPSEWNGDIFDLFCYILFKIGYVPVFYDKDMGNVFSFGEVGGVNFWFAPTYCIISNPTKNITLSIGNNKVETPKTDGVCEILKLTPDYRGIWDIIEYYAAKLANLDCAIDMGIENSKFAFFLGAKNKSMAAALKKMFDKAHSGEALVVYDSRMGNDPASKDVPWQEWTRNVKDSFILPEQLECFKSILHAFDSEIGIPTLPVEKKERMIDAEARSTDRDSLARSDIWIQTFNQSAIKVNERFGLNISMKRKEIVTDGARDLEPDRAV